MSDDGWGWYMSDDVDDGQLDGFDWLSDPLQDLQKHEFLNKGNGWDWLSDPPQKHNFLNQELQVYFEVLQPYATDDRIEQNETYFADFGQEPDFEEHFTGSLFEGFALPPIVYLGELYISDFDCMSEFGRVNTVDIEFDSKQTGYVKIPTNYRNHQRLCQPRVKDPLLHQLASQLLV